MAARYVIGIDLGTTNSVLAYAPLGVDTAEVAILPIPQLTAASTVESRTLLPSFLYLAANHERDSKSYDLPWAAGRDFAVGELARKQAADVPTRTVVAAKSWLSQSRFDRHSPLLPFGAPAEVAKVSPVAASRRYLQHMVDAWHAVFPDAPIAQQQVVVTVPASFDAAARELTREAAVTAGLPDNLVLLEEPQAAVYAWLSDVGERWRSQMHVGDTLLVCDVGGGTSDFTLIRVGQQSGELTLERVAVGNHILVGGDNMDLALAHQMAEVFKAKGTSLDAWQSVSLWHACRAAKETLLSADGPKKHPVSVLGRSSKLIGGTVTADVQRVDAIKLLVDGFFPECAVTDRPAKRAASGFRQLGLAYESDPAITRHLAEFLATNAASNEPVVRPTHILFNGGVFKADALRQRLFDVMGGWFGKDRRPLGLEGNHDLDLAVARGAAYYGLAKQGRGVRIRGGTARSYYVGIETAGLAIPGAARPLNALCVVPFGMEEGTELDVPGDEIGLVVGEQVALPLLQLCATQRRRAGHAVAIVERRRT